MHAVLVTRGARKAGKADPVPLVDQIPFNARNRPALLGFECSLKSHQSTQKLAHQGGGPSEAE